MEKNTELVEAMKKAGVTCRSCWWQEGGRCYAEPCVRMEDNSGRSIKMADSVCEQHTNKRSVLSQFLPSEMLTISSEEKAKNNGKTPPNY